LAVSSNLSNFWVSADHRVSADHEGKIRLQEILFPQGILYDKEIADYRTTSVNVMTELARLSANNSGEEKSGQPKFFFDLSALVPKAGIEPARPKAHDFESCASTSSATQAF
jgi:hypothetical protein